MENKKPMGRPRKGYKAVCLSFPPEFIEIFDGYAEINGCDRNEAIMQLVRKNLPESELLDHWERSDDSICLRDGVQMDCQE
jgi:metal-responsive CopG/Arc/MetJ family transcriptional regulator